MITIKNISRCVKGKTAVAVVNTNILLKKVTCIIGQSGSGKTSLIKLLTGLVKPSRIDAGIEASIAFNFKDETIDIVKDGSKGLKKLRKKCRLIFQELEAPFNPKMNIGEILTEALNLRNKKIEKNKYKKETSDMMELCGLPNPDQYLLKRAYQLSGGQKKKIGFAKAMLTDPQLIIADEPFIAISEKDIRDLKEMIKKQPADKHFIIVTHDLTILQHFADQVFVIHNGQIVYLTDDKTEINSLNFNNAEANELVQNMIKPNTIFGCEEVKKKESKKK